MPARSSLNVSLTPQLSKFVKGRVASGRYQTASEVVREALRMMENHERQRAEAYTSLKKRIQDDAAASERGEWFDGEEVFEELRRRSALRRRRKAS
jgi:antitoxin ParD1/3/4